MRKILLIALAGILMFAGGVMAAQVTLQWDPASGPEPSGYALFERNYLSGGLYDYESPIWPTDGIDHTETETTIAVADNVEHAFILRAYLKQTALDGSVSLNWSGDSNEVIFTPDVQVESPKNLILGAVQYLSQAIDNLVAAVKKLDAAP